MDGGYYFNAAGFRTPRARGFRRSRGHSQRFALLAIIVVVTFAVLIGLDYAGIYLPAGDVLLAASPLD